MNVSGFTRGYMSKNMTGETFFMKVADTIEKQLQEWDSTYHVLLLKLKDSTIKEKYNIIYVLIERFIKYLYIILFKEIYTVE